MPNSLTFLVVWVVALSLAILGVFGAAIYMIEHGFPRQPPTSQWSPAGSASASVHIEAKRDGR